jgi:hypothetical protein
MSLDFDFGFSGTFINMEFAVENLSDGNIVYDFDFGTGVLIFPVLRGLSNYHVAIWCDPKASLTNGRFYVSTKNSLTIINNRNGTAVLEDYYSQEIPGATMDTLKVDDIVDLNVAFS